MNLITISLVANILYLQSLITMILQTSPPIVDLEINDIEGIGPTTTKKLKEAGIVSVMDLAVASAEELAIDINSSKESAATFVKGAQKLLRDSKRYVSR